MKGGQIIIGNDAGANQLLQVGPLTALLTVIGDMDWTEWPLGALQDSTSHLRLQWRKIWETESYEAYHIAVSFCQAEIMINHKKCYSLAV
ncbi:MAG: hypothetical protein WAN35_12595 [Terracidiphilus sp.]